jgi:hypothetical protein
MFKVILAFFTTLAILGAVGFGFLYYMSYGFTKIW